VTWHCSAFKNPQDGPGLALGAAPGAHLGDEGEGLGGHQCPPYLQARRVAEPGFGEFRSTTGVTVRQVRPGRPTLIGSRAHLAVAALLQTISSTTSQSYLFCTKVM
jgi:hypothetical protein